MRANKCLVKDRKINKNILCSFVKFVLRLESLRSEFAGFLHFIKDFNVARIQEGTFRKFSIRNFLNNKIYAYFRNKGR